MLLNQKPKPKPATNWAPFDPLEDYCEYWIGHGDSSTREVFEEDDDEETRISSLVGPNGEPIFYHSPSTKQGYIGFVPPDILELIGLENEQERLKAELAKRNAKKKRRKKNADPQ